jgi:hypothetical protein
MTKKELDAQAEHVAEQQKKFVNTLYIMFDVVDGLRDYLKGFPRDDGSPSGGDGLIRCWRNANDFLNQLPPTRV